MPPSIPSSRITPKQGFTRLLALALSLAAFTGGLLPESVLGEREPATALAG